MNTLAFKIETMYKVSPTQAINVLFIATHFGKEASVRTITQGEYIHVRYLTSGEIEAAKHVAASNSFDIVRQENEWIISANDKVPLQEDQQFLDWAKDIILDTVLMKFSTN